MVCLFVCSVCLTVQRNLERSVEGSSVLRRGCKAYEHLEGGL